MASADLGATRRVRIGTRAELDTREIVQVEVGTDVVATFLVGGVCHALDGRCPHRGGPLGEGTLRGSIVTCPWHRWTFDVTTGRCISHPGRDVRRWPVTIDGDDVWVELG